MSIKFKEIFPRLFLWQTSSNTSLLPKENDIFNRAVAKNVSKLSLGTLLIVPFVLQILVTVGIIGYLSFKNGQKAVNDLASQLMDEVSDRAAARLDDYLEIPHLINAINDSAIRLNQLDVNDLSSFEKHFWQQIQLFESVGFIYFANEDGELIGVERWDDGSLNIDEVKKTNPGNFKIYGTDDRGKRTNVMLDIDNFEPRQRPWYRTAMKAGRGTWGEIFSYKGSPRVAIAAVIPLTTETRCECVSPDQQIGRFPGFTA